jgi:hypothetical protein
MLPWLQTCTEVLAMVTVIDTLALASVRGGLEVRSALKSAYDGGVYAAQATRNFGTGFAGGALHGVGASDGQIARYGDRNAPGFAPGVETGMMFNMALGPVGGLLATATGSIPAGSVSSGSR